MAKWEKPQDEVGNTSKDTRPKDAPSQLKVPGAPDTDTLNEAQGIIDKDAVAHSHIDIAGGIPDTDEDDLDDDLRPSTSPRRASHVDIHGQLTPEARSRIKTQKCVVTSGQLLVREEDGTYANYPVGTTFDAPKGHVASYLAAGNVALVRS